MSDEWPVLEEFYPILAQNYIRFQVAAHYVKAKEAQSDNFTVKFKIEKEFYDIMMACDVQALLIGLELNYDEASAILTVEPDDYFREEYTNQIMCDVAIKQAELCRVRYSKFINVVAEE